MTAFTLKVIALTAMVMDHIGAIFSMQLYDMQIGGFSAAQWCRIIGRLAFPIFVYLIAEGCRHTKSMERYLLRLGAFALISEIPFDMAFHQSHDSYFSVDFMNGANIFYTLFLGALGIYTHQLIREKCRVKWQAWLFTPVVVFALMMLADYFSTDYGPYGVAFVFIMHIIPIKPFRLAAMALCCAYQFESASLGLLYRFTGIPALSRYAFTTNGFIVAMLIGCLSSVLLAALYNGKRGYGMKWLFYFAYPAHLLVLAGIWLWIVRPGL